MEYVRIPQRRIGVLIGPDGATRKEFEEATGCALEIDSRTGIVHVTIPEGGDALLGLPLQLLRMNSKLRSKLYSKRPRLKTHHRRCCMLPSASRP